MYSVYLDGTKLGGYCFGYVECVGIRTPHCVMYTGNIKYVYYITNHISTLFLEI